ncbi:J domain-containing protein [Leptolyngbya ohadii]|uniref:J domain-containing protein n=1 Tax=Leptolyngbya ohadii TaxID=1962290 RepID=UPI000B59A237|nr:DnaJ domain-containing protein [Leptolyngbya ohadii]
MPKQDQNYYKILGVSRDASAEDIRQAYRKLARVFHPDIQMPHDSTASKGQTEEQMKRLNQAYAVLRDPEKRRQYDRQLDKFDSPAVPQTSYQWTGTQIDVRFSQAEMDAIAAELREEEAIIKRDCSICIQAVEAQYASYLGKLPNHKPGEKYPQTQGGKISSAFALLILVPISIAISSAVPTFVFALMVSYTLEVHFRMYRASGIVFREGFKLYVLAIGALTLLVFFYYLRQVVKESSYSRAYCDAIRACTNRANDRLSQLKQQRLSRIAHFRSLLVKPITDDFIRSLSPRDRFFLLQAMREKEAEEKARREREERRRGMDY